MPFVDGGVELHAGVAADVGALGDFSQQLAGILFLAGIAIADALGPPIAALDGSLHELVAGAHREVFVLIHHRAIGVAVVAAVIALLDECPGLFLLEGLGFDKFLDVRMPILEGVHLGGSAGLAAGFNHVGHLVINTKEGQRARWAAAAGEFFAGGAQGGKVRTGARTVLE